MTFSLLKAQVLLKAAQHKYTHRKLIGRDPKTNRKRYRYYYAEHHGGGITSAEIEAGSAFKLTFKGRRGHFHVQSVEGDTVTVKHDGRPNSKPVEMTKAEFRALLKRQHETVENKKREKAQENRRRGRKKRKGSKRTKRKTAPQTQAQPPKKTLDAYITEQDEKIRSLKTQIEKLEQEEEASPRVDNFNEVYKIKEEIGTLRRVREVTQRINQGRPELYLKVLKDSRDPTKRIIPTEAYNEIVGILEDSVKTQAPEQTPQVQEPEQGADNFETMPEVESAPAQTTFPLLGMEDEADYSIRTAISGSTHTKATEKVARHLSDLNARAEQEIKQGADKVAVKKLFTEHARAFQELTQKLEDSNTPRARSFVQKKIDTLLNNPPSVIRNEPAKGAISPEILDSKYTWFANRVPQAEDLGITPDERVDLITALEKFNERDRDLANEISIEIRDNPKSASVQRAVRALLESQGETYETMPEPDPSPAREQLTETARSGGLSTEDVKEMDEAVDRFRFTPEEIQSMNLGELAEIREAFTEVLRDPRRKYYNDPEYKALSEAHKTAAADKDRPLSEALDIMDEMDDMENRFNARYRVPLSDLIKPINERHDRLQRNKRAKERRAEKKRRKTQAEEANERRERREAKEREEQARIDEATNRRMIAQDDAREMLGKPRKYSGSPAREQLTETARGVETPPVKKKRARKPKKFGSSIPSKDELLEEFKGITETFQIGNRGNPVLSQVFKVLNSPNTTKEQKNKFKRGLNLPLLNLNDPYEVESYLSERETRTGRGSDLFLPSALKAHGTSLDPFNVSEQAQEETGKVYNLYSSPSATNEESGLAFVFGTIKAEGVKPKRGLWAIHRDSGRLALVDDTVKPHQAPAILTFLGEELKDQLAKVNPNNPEHMKIFGRATRSVGLTRQQRQADLAEMLARILNDPRLNKSLIGLNLLDLYKALRC